MRYIIQYTLPYEHRVMVGIEAESPETAIAKAGELFDQGDIWQDSADVPLLYDDFEEQGDAGVPLEFTVEAEVSGDWPEAGASVTAIRRRDAAFQAVRLLLETYRRGEERGGSIDWEDLDQAYQAALQASGSSPETDRPEPSPRCSRLAVVIEGGIVQSVIADQPGAAPAVAVVDYDIEGQAPAGLCDITQSDGSRSKAYVVAPWIEPARIDLDEVFRLIDA